MNWKQKSKIKIRAKIFKIKHSPLERIAMMVGKSNFDTSLYESDWNLLEGDFIYGSPIKLSDFQKQRDEYLNKRNNENITKGN